MIGKIGRDQLEDYASRRELSVSDVENLLNKNV